MQSESSSNSSSSLYVRQSSGLVRQASVSVLSIIVILGLAYLVLSYQQPGMNTAQLGPLPGFIFMGSLIVIGLVIFYVARFVRARQGINLDLIYSELPPE